MNDNYIIKALECCVNGTTSDVCKCCPFVGTTMCIERGNGLLKYSLELINRQKAEIERLQKENSENFNKWLILDKRTQERYAELYEESKGVVRTEAIKEFAERLKETPIRFRVDHTTDYTKTPVSKMVLFIDDSDIDDLVKEMMEGEDEPIS